MKNKKQFYAPYTEWEDYQNGMYGMEVKMNQVSLSVSLLQSPKDLLNAMRLVILEWPISTLQNMTAKGNNKQSWLGQAACCIKHKSTECETRLAWGELSDEQRILANDQADIIILEYEAKDI